ncbi:transport permease protein [Dictyobacter alpinus]|uniref:Transport permease protein n=1 Tax=Dictyobacter alpinus TaxID=2014873 RepID=A0A402BHR7_9CHLR|nr:ABC transporter permease [Dictyobacter alpinus]GCE30797.1 transport permease protein [Dictyobacter alpinus]
MKPAFFRSVWAIIKKDIRVWLSNRRNIAATVVPPIAFLLIQALGAVAVGRSPVALVTLDAGAKGQQMQHIFHAADVFRITDATPAQAANLYKNIQVIAVITIPADFTQRIQAHDPAPIEVHVNNLNLDFTNDIRRSVPDAITQFYQAQGTTSPIKVTIQEQDLRTRDVQLFQYAVLPTIILLLTLSGLVTASIATAREWETYTIKEMLLSPLSRTTIIVGKVLAGFVTTFLLGVLVLLIGAALDWTRPVGIYWLTSLLILAVLVLFSTGLGVALGAALHKSQPVIAISINITIYLFFLAGGIGVLAFEPLWLQNIAAFIPLTYGIHALEQAIFYSSSDLFGHDILILGLCALAALGLGVLSMRRGIAK